MRKQKTPKNSYYETRRVVTNEHLNPHGTLFGGQVMCWIDEVAYMSARKYSGVPFVVTVNMDGITFLSPVRLGEHVVLSSSVNYVGRSSMEIGVKVEVEDPDTGKRVHANSAYCTFVALDKWGKPKRVPKLLLETDEDFRRHEEARIRVKVRDRMKRRLASKLDQRNKSEQTARPELVSFGINIKKIAASIRQDFIEKPKATAQSWIDRAKTALNS